MQMFYFYGARLVFSGIVPISIFSQLFTHFSLPYEPFLLTCEQMTTQRETKQNKKLLAIKNGGLPPTQHFV